MTNTVSKRDGMEICLRTRHVKNVDIICRNLEYFSIGDMDLMKDKEAKIMALGGNKLGLN